MDRLERTENQTRSITALLSCGCSLQHGKITLPLIVLFLLLSPAIPTVRAQTRTNGTATEPYPYTKFTPSMAIIIVVLIGALFLMGFFSIYIRHCSEGDGSSVRNTLAGLSASMRARRGGAASRGLDAAVLETFPTFAYSVVKGLKVGKGALECAVCLNEFEDDETLRLIPKCDHVFHPDCIDAWLTSHVTCPVCRADLVPQPGDTVQVAAEHTDVAEEIESPQTDDVSIQIGDDHDDATVQQHPPQVMDRNVSSKWSRNRPPRSRSVRSVLFGKFPRSHSTGHSLVNPGENTDRFTLRLPDEIRKQVMSRALNRTKSCVVVFPTEDSSRRGYRTGGLQEGSSRGRFYRRLDREAKSDRWVFSIVPPFLSREPSVKSPKVVAGDGEGTSVTTPRSLVTAVKTQFNCLEPKADETKLVSGDSVRPPV